MSTEDVSDFASGYATTFAPALTSAYAAGLTGATAFSTAFAAAGPVGLVLGALSALSGRSKRRRARRAAAKKLAQQRVESRGAARGIGRQGQQAVGGVVASATQFGGTLSAGMSQGVMGNVFLEQQRTMQRVGLSVQSMAKARDKALRRKALRKGLGQQRFRGSQGQHPDNPVTRMTNATAQKEWV